MQLPRESRTVQASLGEDGEWTWTNQLLAALIDHTRMTNWILANLHAKPHERAPLPQPIPRPGVAAKPSAASLTPQMLADFYERHNTTT